MPSFLSRLGRKKTSQPASTATEEAAPVDASNDAMQAELPAEAEEGPGLLDQFAAGAGRLGRGAKRKARSAKRLAGSAASAVGGAAEAAVSGVAGLFDEPEPREIEEADVDKALSGPIEWNNDYQLTEGTANFWGDQALSMFASGNKWGEDVRHEGQDTAQARRAAPRSVPEKLDDRVTNYLFAIYPAPIPDAIYSASVFAKEAFSELDNLKLDDFNRYYEMGLRREEIMAIALYTTNAAYTMNAILRGQVDNDTAIAGLSPWIDLCVSGMAKLPRGAQNAQNGGAVDDAQNDDAWVDFDTVYRADHWGSAFTPLVRSEFAVGATIGEPAFLSTAVVPGLYGVGAVKRTIHNASAGKMIRDFSKTSAENEALFAPGTEMRIDTITDRTTGEAVDDLGATYGDTLEQNKFDVEATMLGGGTEAGGVTSDGDPVSAEDTVDPLQAAVGGIEENALGA